MLHRCLSYMSNLLMVMSKCWRGWKSKGGFPISQVSTSATAGLGLTPAANHTTGVTGHLMVADHPSLVDNQVWTNRCCFSPELTTELRARERE